MIVSHNHYIKEPTVSGRHRKAFCNIQSCLTDSSWIHLILLIKLIQYKKRKNTIAHSLQMAWNLFDISSFE